MENLLPDFEHRWALIQDDIMIPERPIEPPLPQLDPLPHRAGLLKPGPVTHPSDSLLTRNQHYMLAEFQSYGRQGLGSAIYKIAFEFAQLPSAANFHLLADDQANKTYYVLQLLRTLPDTIIESLIKCTLPYDYHKGEGSDLQAFVDNEMKLMDTPGIYLSLPNLGKAQGGKCLTGRHLKDVLNSIELYLKDDPLDHDENRKIDAFFTGDGEILERRWGKGERSKIVVEEWIARVKEMYLQKLPEVDLDEHFTRCLAKCGWGLNMTLRAAHHPKNADTTYLFAPYNILTRRLGFPTPLQLTLFPIWTKKVELCRIAEIVGHILCSTYWFEGGLNTNWAGGVEDIEASTFLYDLNKKKISDRLETIELLQLDHDESKLKVVRNVVTVKQQEIIAHQEYLDEKAKYEEARMKAQEAQRISKEVKEAVNELRDLTMEKGRLLDQHRSNQTSYSDRMSSIRERARNLPRNTQ